VDGGDVWALVAVAEEAGEGEILGRGGAALLLGNDMIDRVGEGREGLREPAVFAAGLGALPDQPFKRGVHAGHPGRRGSGRAVPWTTGHRASIPPGDSSPPRPVPKASASPPGP